MKKHCLTDRELKTAAAKDKDYVLSDGSGLQFRVRKNGSKLWNFNYIHPHTKKRVNMGLGTYPTVSMKLARNLADQARELVIQGIDPKQQREQKRIEAAEKAEHTFLRIAEDWFQTKKEEVTPKHADDIWRSLERHIFADLGNVPISQIRAPSTIKILKRIEAKGSLETVKRLSQRINEVMNYAVNYGLVQSNPLTGIRVTFKKPTKEHMPSLAPNELPELMQTLARASIKIVTRCLIEWQLHTMARPSEASGARWEELDLQEKTWTIPAERMKKKRQHIVPLTEQCLALLEVLKPISGHREFVFPSDRDPKKPCNSQTANMALKRMGFAGRTVSHGLRALASTTLNEQGFDSDLIEMALAHVDSNEVRKAYNRADYLERRRPMMCWWSQHIENASQGSLSITGTKAISLVDNVV